MPTGMQGWEVVTPRLYLTLEDVTIERILEPTARNPGLSETGVTLEIIRYADVFALNDIPQASVTVALGRKATDLSPSQIHFIQNTLLDNITATVWARVSSTGRVTAGVPGFAPSSWPARGFKIFYGKTITCNYERSSTGVQFTIGLIHWLSELNKTSVLSEHFNPASIASLSSGLTPSAGLIGDLREIPAGGTTATILGSAANFVTPQVIQFDMWGGTEIVPAPGGRSGNGILGWLSTLSRYNAITLLSPPIGLPGSLDGDRTNLRALEALRRFEPYNSPTRDYTDGVPLRLTGAALVDSTDLPIAIANNLSLLRHDAIQSQTVWDVLLRIAANYMCAIVPLVDSALFVPYVHGLRNVFATITAADIADLKTVAVRPSSIRAVAITGWEPPLAGTAPSTAVGPDGAPPVFQLAGLGGWFQGAEQGIIRVFEGPPWLSALNHSRSALSTLSPGSSSSISPSAIAAASLPFLISAPAASLLLEVGTRAERESRLRSIRDEFARTMFVHERLRARQLEIATNLRFDIAPGSTVCVEGAGEQFLSTTDDLAKERYGSVVQVSNILDAEAGTAGTIYKISHTRNNDENADPASSLPRHPLWADNWIGAKLIDFDRLGA